MGINFISKVFGKQAPTSTTIAAEIDRSTKERDDIQRKIGAVHADLAGMSDDEHRAADERAAAMRRSVDRLNDGIVKLQKAHDDAIIAEESAQAAAKDEALRTRSEACRKSVNFEAKALLTEYDSLAEQMATVISRITEIEIEVTEVNKALRANRVAEDVQSVAQTWRTTPGTEGTEQRAKVLHWVYRDAPPQPDEVYQGETEMVVRATLDDAGKPIPQAGVQRVSDGSSHRRWKSAKSSSREPDRSPLVMSIRLMMFGCRPPLLAESGTGLSREWAN